MVHEAANRDEEGDPDSPPLSRRATVGQQVERLVTAIRDGDDAMVERTVLALSQRSRWLAPLALLVGAFAMLFQGVKLLFTNWRLTLVQVLPAMWIWAAMLDLKAHALHGKEFHILRGPLLAVVVLVIVAFTAGSYYLNAVFAFAISKSGPPQIRPAFKEARQHIRTILAWGLVVGLALGFATMVVDRWGKFWFSLTLSIVVALMMLTYVAVPARLIGVKSERSTRDKLTASAVGGAVGAIVCSPPFALGRFAILLLGSHTFRYLAILLLLIAVVLQTGATSSVKAIKVSAKLAVGKGSDAQRDVLGVGPVEPNSTSVWDDPPGSADPTRSPEVLYRRGADVITGSRSSVGGFRWTRGSNQGYGSASNGRQWPKCDEWRVRWRQVDLGLRYPKETPAVRCGSRYRGPAFLGRRHQLAAEPSTV